MRIRTQLAIAFLLLAIVPLTGIVLYSYVSSLRAVRSVAEKEAAALTREMDGRMDNIQAELGRGVERLKDVPFDALVAAAESERRGGRAPVFDRVVRGFGDAAPLVESVELVPAPPEAPLPPEAPEGQRRIVLFDMDRMMREIEAASQTLPEHREPTAAEATEMALKMVEGIVDGVVPPQAPPAPPTPGGAAPPAPATPQWKEEMRREIEKGMAEARREMARAQGQAEAKRDAVQDKARELGMRRGLEVPVWEGGKVVGTVKARVRDEAVVRRVLERTRQGEGEVPFAIDAKGRLQTVRDEDRARLEALPLDLPALARDKEGRRVLDDWVVVTSRAPESGLTFGIARPVPLEEVRSAAARNFGYGLGMIGLALLGILPLSRRLTRDLQVVTAGAEKIAQGDLDTRVPVRSKDEVGKLALAFNQMAHDLSEHERRRVEDEKLRREQEMERRLLEAEYDRKTAELEEARRFQLSLLPKALPDHPAFDIAVSMQTATEVGGDYYDFHLAGDGTLTVAIGDATGHGLRAGTMVTAIKSLFSATGGAMEPGRFLDDAARAVKRMELERMAMALALARIDGSTLTVSAAGMPPALLFRRATGRAEEIAVPGMPLGGLAFDYQEKQLEIAPGDTLLLMTDGLPELTNGTGDPLGYPRVRSLFESLAGRPPVDLIAALVSEATAWAGGEAPKDDITLVVVRVRD